MTQIRTALLLGFLLAGFAAAPEGAEAQGRGNGRGRGNVEDVDRRDREGPYDRWDDRRREDLGRDERGNGPPFCRNGQGHPVHGRQWCRDKGYGLGGGSLDDILYGDGRDYDYRYDRASYDRAHSDFHRALDRRYADLAARRPLDLQYQLELRREKALEHDRWHERAGIRH